MRTAPSPEFEQAHRYGSVPFHLRLPIPATLLDLLARQSRTRGDAPFLTTVSAAGETATLTYEELERLSSRYARWLARESGAARGDVVGLLPLNDAASVVAIFGILRLGCAVLFLNPADPAGRLAQQTEALGARVVVRSPGVDADRFAGALPVPAAGDLPGAPAPEPEPPADPAADAFFFGTSGSTAASKLVAQCHYNAAVNAEAVRRHHGLHEGDRLLACLPLHHVNALHLTVFGTLAAGAHVVFAHAMDPFGYPRLLERFRPRIASVVPSILEALLGTWRGGPPPAEFGYFVSAAAPLSARTAQGVWERLGARVMQGYGLTETVNFSTTIPPDISAEAYRRFVLEADIPSVGTALYGNDVSIRTADGGRAAPGAVGEVCIRGHNVMMGYAGNPAATAEAFRGGWFHTQDLGYEREDPETGRRYFVLTGRLKNIAKVRGESVSLDEMDRVLRAHPGVKDCAAVAVPDGFLGEKILVAVVCPGQVTDADLRAVLAAAFPPTALPGRVIRMDAIPRTPTGKILRLELARMLGHPPGG